MTTAKKGDWVFVHYTGTLDNGEQFDSSRGGDPLDFILGSGDLIEGFDKAIDGMAIGDKKQIHLTPAEAYGEYDKEKIMVVEREMFGGDDVEPDMQIGLHMEDGSRVLATITKVTDKEVTIDTNHPMAGKALNFDLELVDIKDAADMPVHSCSGSCHSCHGCH